MRGSKSEVSLQRGTKNQYEGIRFVKRIGIKGSKSQV
jgi:hypothetical protein